MKLELSKSAEMFDAAWEVEPGRVWLRPWMSIIGRQFLKPLVHMVLKSLKSPLTKSTSECAYKNYDMVVPWKNAAWDNVWREFVQRVIMSYMMHGLGEVHDKWNARTALVAARLDGLIRWGSKLSPDTMVHLL